MTREITHMKAFAAALESMGKPRFAIGKIAPTAGLVNQFFNDSTGQGDHGEIDARGPWNEGDQWEFVEAPAFMPKSDELRHGAPGETAVHICVDMQRMFAEATDWQMPWLERVLPNIVSITSAHSESTIFTRFVPARKPGQGAGMWRHYYERWRSMTIDELGPEMIGLVPDLAKFVPPARTFDKHVYSPWTGSDLHLQLRNAGIDTIVITGGETDVCVLSTMLGAIDWGFRVILVTDALCSSADETHDAMMNVYTNRFGEQAETVTTNTLLESWPGKARERRAS